MKRELIAESHQSSRDCRWWRSVASLHDSGQSCWRLSQGSGNQCASSTRHGSRCGKPPNQGRRGHHGKLLAWWSVWRERSQGRERAIARGGKVRTQHQHGAELRHHEQRLASSPPRVIRRESPRASASGWRTATSPHESYRIPRGPRKK